MGKNKYHERRNVIVFGLGFICKSRNSVSYNRIQNYTGRRVKYTVFELMGSSKCCYIASYPCIFFLPQTHQKITHLFVTQYKIYTYFRLAMNNQTCVRMYVLVVLVYSCSSVDLQQIYIYQVPIYAYSCHKLQT